MSLLFVDKCHFSLWSFTIIFIFEFSQGATYYWTIIIDYYFE